MNTLAVICAKEHQQCVYKHIRHYIKLTELLVYNRLIEIWTNAPGMLVNQRQKKNVFLAKRAIYYYYYIINIIVIIAIIIVIIIIIIDLKYLKY